MFNRVRFRSVLNAVFAVLFAGSSLAIADLGKGVLVMEMEGSTSQVRWEGGPVMVPPQQLDQLNPCNLSTVPTLLSIVALNGHDEGAKFDSVGVKGFNGNGTSCSSMDQKGSAPGEALELSLGSDPNLTGLSIIRWLMELELKGDAVRLQIDIFSGATPAARFEVRGGAAVGTPVDPGVTAIDCFENSDVNPDSRDTCIVDINAFGDRAVLTSLEGSIALEGGKSTPIPLADDPDQNEFTQFFLTSAEGILDCGDVIATSGPPGLLGSSTAQCVRLENLEDCPETACIAIPFEFTVIGTETVNLTTDGGGQCPAYQCQIEWAPEPMPLPRTNPTVFTGPNPDNFTEFPSLPLTIVQFLSTDDFFFLQPCLGAPIYNTQANVINITGTFNVGDAISVLGGGIGSPTATVLSYMVIDGQATLIYALDDPLLGDFADLDTLVGPVGQGDVSGVPEDSDFLRLLHGGISIADGGAVPGFLFPDLSPPPGKTNAIGVQYACDLRRQISIPSEDTFAPFDDFYFQGDFRAARDN